MIIKLMGLISEPLFDDIPPYMSVICILSIPILLMYKVYLMTREEAINKRYYHDEFKNVDIFIQK